MSPAMTRLPRSIPQLRFSPAFILLCALLAAIWLGGGASRADALGQSVVRASAWGCLILALLLGPRPAVASARVVWLILALAILLPLLQLIPLPPATWQALPGRALLVDATAGGPQPWRPWAIVPGATWNAASSLVVPLSVCVLVSSISTAERAWLPGVVLALVVGSTVVGLLQFSGIGFNNPLINDQPGEVSGSFANRNHFAVFLAFGCMLAPVWAFLDDRSPEWRAPFAFGLVLLFALTILACGSRTGLVLGALGGLFGLLMVRKGVQRTLRRYPKWVTPVLIASVIGVAVLFVLISIAADRAIAINRLLELEAGQDLRRRALPTVVEMVRLYMPFGTGLGGFDQIYRIHEPFDMLALNYFNHAHNDFLEIALDTGVVGIAFLAVAILWWLLASIRVWRAGPEPRFAEPKLGSAMILLVLIASVFDYPARTPMMMAMLVVAGIWLTSPVRVAGSAALRKRARDV